MIREIIVPTQSTYILHIPDDLIGKNVEVIAFATDPLSNKIDNSSKRTLEQAIAFFDRNSIDMSKVEKWNREDLYE